MLLVLLVTHVPLHRVMTWRTYGFIHFQKVTTQMRCLTWERPCHTRNRVGHVVMLLVYVELEVKEYMELLYRDVKVKGKGLSHNRPSRWPKGVRVG